MSDKDVFDVTTSTNDSSNNSSSDPITESEYEYKTEVPELKMPLMAATPKDGSSSDPFASLMTTSTGNQPAVSGKPSEEQDISKSGTPKV